MSFGLVFVSIAICSHNGFCASPLSHCILYGERNVKKAEPIPTYAYAFINLRFQGTEEVASLSANIPGCDILPTVAY